MEKRFLRGCVILLLIGNVLLGAFLWRQQRLEIANRNWLAEQMYEIAPEQAVELVPLLFEERQYSDGSLLAAHGYTADGFEHWYQASGLAGEYALVMVLALFFSFGVGGIFCIGYRREKETIRQLSEEIASQEETVPEIREGMFYPCWEALKKLRLREQGLKAYCQEENARARTFVENIAHQVKTPLCGIQLTLETIGRHFSGEEMLDPAEAELLIRDSVEENDRLQELLVRLMKIGRLEAGKVFLEREKISLKEMLAHWKSQLEISGELTVQGDTLYWGDYEWLQEAFYNLLSNCKEYGDQVDIQVEGNKEQICVEISDNGGGIAVESLPHVFDRFYTSSSTEHFHMGIGLNLAKEIVKAHQGIIQVSNRREGGAQFRLIFPRFAALK